MVWLSDRLVLYALRQLSEENRRLQEYQDRESKANKRLSMENEQLQYKLRNHSQSEMPATPGEPDGTHVTSWLQGHWVTPGCMWQPAGVQRSPEGRMQCRLKADGRLSSEDCAVQRM